MVEYTLQLDSLFHALSDPLRRDIVNRVAQAELTIGELAANYAMSFAGVSKHLAVLEKARLIRKRKEGRNYLVTLETASLEEADRYLEQYRHMWEERFNKLETLLTKGDSYEQRNRNQRS